jgi:hypothetical protein
MEVPHGLNDRQEKIQAHSKEIEILKIFSEKLSPNVFGNINALKSAKVIGNTISGNASLDDFLDAIDIASDVISTTVNTTVGQSSINLGKEAKNKEELVQELQQDIESISHLLQEPIFEAAGVLQYCLQEVERAKEFIEREIQGTELNNVIFSEFDKNNIPDLSDLNQEYRHKNESSADISKLYAEIWH